MSPIQVEFGIEAAKEITCDSRKKKKTDESKSIKSFQLSNFFYRNHPHILGYVNVKQLDVSMLDLIAFQ